MARRSILLLIWHAGLFFRRYSGNLPAMLLFRMRKKGVEEYLPSEQIFRLRAAFFKQLLKFNSIFGGSSFFAHNVNNCIYVWDRF